MVNDVVYVGSWDGYEYALNAATGTLMWKVFLGTTPVGSSCYMPGESNIGVYSTAAVQNGVVYVGGGDAYFYALDAVSGAVLWKIYGR